MLRSLYCTFLFFVSFIFAISVQVGATPILPVNLSDVSLAWDQSVSPNLCGNKVYYGTSSGIYGTPITLPLQTEFTVIGLTAGTYYFAVTAFDCNGNESDFSNEVSQVINGGTVILQPVTISGDLL